MGASAAMLEKTTLLTRIGLLVAVLALSVGFPLSQNAVAQTHPQCSDGIDNDGDNAIDGADTGCLNGDDNDESDSPYSIIKTVPLPLVTLQGTVSSKGVVKVKRLLIRAQRGSTVD